MKRAFLHAAACEWRVPLRLARLVFWLPLLASAVLLAMPFVYARLTRDGRWLFQRGFELALREDGPIEWGQVLCFAVAALAAGACARRLFGSGRTLQGALFAVGALGLFLVVGEEVSWGQRILGLETPEWLAQINQQEELNAHNIAGVRGLLDYPRILLGLWGALGFLVVPRVARIRVFSLVSFPLAPPVFLSSSFAVMLAYDLLRATLWSEPGFFLRLMRHGEWPELCFAFGLGAFLMLSQRRLAGTRASAVGSSSEQRRGAA